MAQARFRHIRNWSIGGRILVVCLAVFSGRVLAGMETLHTNHDVFYIPFTAQPVAPASNAPGQVTLFASGDYGVSWHAYQSQSIAAGRFSFRAGADGEFWFVVRDATTTSLPSGVTPELRVAVDRTAPTLAFQVAWSPPDSIAIDWSVDDAALAEAPVHFEFRPAPEPAGWQPIPAPAAVQREGTRCTGQVRHPVADATREYVLRATSGDKAGNRTVIERRLPARVGVGLADQSAARPPVPPAAPDSLALSLPSPPADAAPSVPAQTAPSRPAASPEVPSELPPQSMAEQWHSSQANESIPQPGGILASLDPALREDRAVAEGVSLPATPPAPAADSAHRFSRSRRFQMDYVVENATPGGVHRVEAWFSNDGGRSWRHYGDDPDRQSPMEIDVAEDGTYGFRLLVQAREGLVAQPPRSGDEPDVWITVDSQPPVARLKSARFTHEAELGSMTISWEARDQMPAEFPIGLYFGETANGPWRKIASELPNAGSYLWQIDDRVPSQFHLRLEVTDRAGNVAVDVLSNPIRRDGFAPQGTIQGIRPIGFRGR